MSLPRIVVRDVRRSGRLVGRRRWAQRLSGCGVATGAVCVERGSEPGYRLGVLGRAGKPDEDRQDLLLGQSFLGYALAISCPQCAGELGKRSTQRGREPGGEKLERLVQGRRVWQAIKRIGLRCSRFVRRLRHACQPGLVALSRRPPLGSWSRFWLPIVWLRLAPRRIVRRRVLRASGESSRLTSSRLMLRPCRARQPETGTPPSRCGRDARRQAVPAGSRLSRNRPWPE